MKPHRNRKPIVGFDPATDAMAPPGYHIRAMLDGLDQVATAMERKWGVGRLRLLVSDLLRAKFDAQKDKLDAAILSHREAYVRIQTEGMKRAWTTLDKAASEAGHRPLSPEVRECLLPTSGEVVAIVHTEAEAQHVRHACRVFTIEEIAQLIEDVMGGLGPGWPAGLPYARSRHFAAKPSAGGLTGATVTRTR